MPRIGADLVGAPHKHLGRQQPFQHHLPDHSPTQQSVQRGLFWQLAARAGQLDLAFV